MGGLLTNRARCGSTCNHESQILGPLIAGAALLLCAPAGAIVGGGAPSAEGIGRSIVTIVGSRGNFCTGALIAPRLVLTAAHCVQPGATYKIVEYGADRQPQLQDVKSIATHPAFSLQAMTAHRATADVALLQLDAPARGQNASALGVPQIPIVVGSRFTIAGIGVTVRGEGKSGGTVRVAGLVATGRPGTLQIRLVDPVGQGTPRRPRRMHRGFRRPCVRGPAGRHRPRWRRQLVDGTERHSRLRRHDRRHAADALSRLDFTDREAVGLGAVSPVGNGMARRSANAKAAWIPPCSGAS